MRPFAFVVSIPLLAGLSPEAAPAMVTTVEQQEQARHPVPSEEVQAEILAKVKELHQEQYEGRGRKNKQELLEELLKLAESLRKTPDDRYVVLMQALETATDLPDGDVALSVARVLGVEYELDAWTLMVDSLVAAAPDTRKEDAERVTASALAFVEECLAKADFDSAERVLEAIKSPARRNKEQRERQREMLLELEKWEGVRAAVKKLRSDPKDKAANGVLGGFHAFDRGDFDLGLPHLARSEDGPIKDLASKDLASPESPSEQAEIGDRWFDLAEENKGPRRSNMLRRCKYWYILCQGSLEGIDHSIVRERLKEIEEEIAEVPVVKQEEKTPEPRVTRRAVRGAEGALAWLAANQEEDGRWDCDGFGQGGEVDGPGDGLNDVGVTGLALLAFLKHGHLPGGGQYGDNVNAAIAWLIGQQDSDSGKIGSWNAIVYNHGYATLALCEAVEARPDLREPAQSAVNHITIGRNPYSGWGYEVPPDGYSDTSISGVMLCAQAAARAAGLKVDGDAFAYVLSLIDELTDPATSRTGYNAVGSASRRVQGLNSHYPAEGEAMTAIAILCRLHAGQSPRKDDILRSQAELLMKRQPEWDPDGLRIDLYYWYYGTEALYQLRDDLRSNWRAWRSTVKDQLAAGQRDDGALAGSWDPTCAWGYAGGRIYSTALGALILANCK